MNPKIQKLLNNGEGNYIMPFFWQHGEDEATLREYIGAIYAGNIRAVCLECRPHPDFCGPKWWRDMDVIMDEARKKGMKVWVLDDSHFPTGFANGAVKNAPDELRRKSVCCKTLNCKPQSKIRITSNMLKHPVPAKLTLMDRIIVPSANSDFSIVDNDILLGVCAIRLDGGTKDILNLTNLIKDGALEWNVPDGNWKIYILHVSRNYGVHRNYINMMDAESCRILIDAVYEPHYEHYKDDFGKTFAGFFSDEPELGNGKIFKYDNPLGTDQDLPWSRELEQRLNDSIGGDYAKFLPLLWENGADAFETANIRYAYMDSVTRLVEKDFSNQIGEWCKNHGVEYIGHLIEDNNEHARTGSSLGHYFRGLSGQHMSGVDIVTRQINPQGEDLNTKGPFGKHDSEFYHYVLAKLGSSQAAIDPIKKGRVLCEIFGNYGWAAGVRLEKYLADHCMVRGINHFVPHAFSPKPFPDSDCPPHFYAGGNDPQYRHFGCLMSYMNRICELISDGRRIVPAAILYHGEAEWTGKCMLMQKPARVLADNQIDFDIIPQDVFLERARYRTEIGDKLHVNTQEYKTLIVPTAQFVTKEFAQGVAELQAAGFPVLFIDRLPEGICNEKDAVLSQELLKKMQGCIVVPLNNLAEYMKKHSLRDISLSCVSKWIRYLHYQLENGNSFYYFVNEGIEPYKGTIKLPGTGHCYAYNAWDNRLENISIVKRDGDQYTILDVEIEPLKSLIAVFDNAGSDVVEILPVKSEGERVPLKDGWMRSTCKGIDYPKFQKLKTINLPDNLAQEQPRFSGFVRYDNHFNLKAYAKIVLEIKDAHEGVEVFVNGKSAGIQIVPTFRFDITEFVREGENLLRIEVATTLERQVGRRGIAAKIVYPKPSALSGITGDVNLYIK